MKKTQQKRRGGKTQKRRGGKTQKRKGGAPPSQTRSSYYKTGTPSISKNRKDPIDETLNIMYSKYKNVIKEKSLDKYIVKNFIIKGIKTPGVNGISYDPSRDHLINGKSQTEMKMYTDFITWMGKGADMNNLPSWIIYVDSMPY